MAKPFVKWVGGKRQLMDALRAHLPGGPIPWTGTYFEPFLGGGAAFFAFQGLGLVKKAVLNDYNAELVNLYRTVASTPASLAQNIKDPRFANTLENHALVRAWDRVAGWEQTHSALERATRFLFLNRTSFNGLWRVNSKGQFNVPFGHFKKPGFPDAAQLADAASALRSAVVLNGDFEDACKDAGAGDFVYLDPPYIPLNASASFTSYTDQGFEEDMQIRLARVCDDLTRRGVLWMLSNSSAPRAIEIFGKCTNAEVHIVHASRSINSNGQGRGKVPEILVTNYPVRGEGPDALACAMDGDSGESGTPANGIMGLEEAVGHAENQTQAAPAQAEDRPL